MAAQAQPGSPGYVYRRPRQLAFDVQVGGSALGVSLNFTAQCVSVENPTSQYLYLPDVPDFVPPYWSGRVRRLKAGTSEANASYQNPPMITPLGVVNGQQAIIIFYEDDIPLSGGSPSAIQLATGITLGAVQVSDTLGNIQPAGSSVNDTIFVNDTANIGFAATTTAINNAAVKLPAVPLAKRRSITIINGSGAALYVGSAGVLGAANGLLVPANGERTLTVGPAVDVYGIVPAGGPVNIETVELA